MHVAIKDGTRIVAIMMLILVISRAAEGKEIDGCSQHRQKNRRGGGGGLFYCSKSSEEPPFLPREQ